MALLPIDENGYGLGPIEMNPRTEMASDLGSHASSRVPDIVFTGTHVGLNYDGEGHFGTQELRKAVGEMLANPGARTAAENLDRTISQTRARMVSDKRRDRDLASAGMTVLAVTKEDLFEQNGLDLVMLQVMSLIERERGCNLDLQRILMRMPIVRAFRQHMIWSAVPGPKRQQAREWLAKANEPIELPEESTDSYLVTFDESGNADRIQRL